MKDTFNIYICQYGDLMPIYKLLSLCKTMILNYYSLLCVAEKSSNSQFSVVQNELLTKWPAVLTCHAM